MSTGKAIRHRVTFSLAVLATGLLQLSSAQACFIDTDGVTDCTFSLRKASITNRSKADTDSWQAEGELNGLASPDLLQQIEDEGVAVAIGTVGGSAGGAFTEVDEIAFAPGECRVAGPRGNRLVCKGDQGRFRLNPRSAPSFYKVVVLAAEREIDLPPLTDTPLAIVLRTPDGIDRGDAVDPCAAIGNLQKISCRRLP